MSLDVGINFSFRCWDFATTPMNNSNMMIPIFLIYTNVKKSSVYRAAKKSPDHRELDQGLSFLGTISYKEESVALMALKSGCNPGFSSTSA